MNATGCPNLDELADSLLGKCSPTKTQVIEVHLAECATCQSSIADLDSVTDPVVMGLRLQAASDTYTNESEYRQALKSLRPLMASQSTDALEETMDFADQEADRRQIGPYRILGKLGEGGMGTVYKAVHAKLDKVVALKVLSVKKLRNDSGVARFEREMKAVGRLQHPNIIQAFDAGENAGVHFLVIEYVEGIDLSKLLRCLGPLAIPDACELVRQAAVGLQYAHENALVHRDIKPSNLMLAVSGQVKVLDLGLALFRDESAMDAEELTTSDQTMGTLDYMAPEQFLDSHKVDIRADIYSLGATLYKLLCGQGPLASQKYNTPAKRMMALTVGQAPSIRERRPDVPDALAAVLKRMLARDPQDRFSIPADVVRALEPFVTGCDLLDLVQKAERGVADGIVADFSLASTTSFHSSAVKGELPRHPSRADSKRSFWNRRWTHWIVFAVLVPLVLAAGIIIWINKNGVRTKLVVPDGSEVEFTNNSVEVTPVPRQAFSQPTRKSSETTRDSSRQNAPTHMKPAGPSVVASSSISRNRRRRTERVVLTPLDLNPSDTYHLAFVTSKTMDATSADIAVYNNFVQTLADDADIGKSRGLTWHVMASTPSVDARDNAQILGPVYDLRGYRLADDASDMWDNSVPILFSIDEYGSSVSRQSVYTGTKNPGVGEPTYELGNSSGSGRSRMGNTGLVNRWLFFNWSPQTTPQHFYALSNMLSVPSGSSKLRNDDSAINPGRNKNTSEPIKEEVRQSASSPPDLVNDSNGSTNRETRFGPSEAYVINHSVRGIVSTDPRQTIRQYGVKMNSEQYQKIAKVDGQSFGQKKPYGYQVFCFENRGPMLLTWCGSAESGGSVSVAVWNGETWKPTIESYRKLLRVAEPTKYSEAVYRPPEEEKVYVLVNGPTGSVYTDAIYLSIRSEQGDR